MNDELKLEDFEDEIKVSISREAFKSRELHCDICNKKMKKELLNIDIPNTYLTIHLEAFRCNKCGKEYLNGEQAKKLDRALAIGNVISEKGAAYIRSGNFDGYNVFVRFPAHMVRGRKIKAEIRPLSDEEFFVHFKKEE